MRMLSLVLRMLEGYVFNAFAEFNYYYFIFVFELYLIYVCWLN